MKHTQIYCIAIYRKNFVTLARTLYRKTGQGNAQHLAHALSTLKLTLPGTIAGALVRITSVAHVACAPSRAVPDQAAPDPVCSLQSSRAVWFTSAGSLSKRTAQSVRVG